MNDGVQNKEESHGKFEEGNKLALTDFVTRVDAPANWLEEETLIQGWRPSCGIRSTPPTPD